MSEWCLRFALLVWASITFLLMFSIPFIIHLTTICTYSMFHDIFWQRFVLFFSAEAENPMFVIGLNKQISTSAQALRATLSFTHFNCFNTTCQPSISGSLLLPSDIRPWTGELTVLKRSEAFFASNEPPLYIQWSLWPSQVVYKS